MTKQIKFKFLFVFFTTINGYSGCTNLLRSLFGYIYKTITIACTHAPPDSRGEELNTYLPIPLQIFGDNQVVQVAIIINVSPKLLQRNGSN